MKSLVQAFCEEFASHVGRSCPLRRELPFHKLVDWDPATGGSPTIWPMQTSNRTGPPLAAQPFRQRRVSSRNVPSSWLDPRWSLPRLLAERPFEQVLVDLGVK